MTLTKEQFLEVIKHAPLVSIDLIIRDSNGRILLGWRVNRPARDRWFVPGSRIKKGETLDEAFRRIAWSEIRQNVDRTQARFLGLDTHKHPDNFLSQEGIGTHYVVLAYELTIDVNLAELPLFPNSDDAQHSKWEWFDYQKAVREDSSVHDFAKAYFSIAKVEQPSVVLLQYHMLNLRRNMHNTLLWQTPALSLAGLSFLMTIALNEDGSVEARGIASFLALITAGASIWLMIRHRYFEEVDAKRLQAREKQYESLGFIVQSAQVTIGFSLYRVWLAMLWIFAASAAFILVSQVWPACVQWVKLLF